MSDRQMRRQHDQITTRNRTRREAEMREAARLAAERNRRHGR